ncbi:MAG: [LysW]-lysine hydrolase [Anaerolineae bacterium]|nr:[LysW]-lysine hydrolase [Anaerolineae bacterium]
MNHELLTELVRHYSPSYHETPAVNYLVDWMNTRGFEAWVDAVGNACGIRGALDAPHTLMLLGHIDTVEGEIPVRIEDGWLYGRGSVDAKGSLCAFADATAQAAISPDWRVMVVGAVEEEAPSSRGARHIRDQYTPDLCMIGEPSSADRITLGYKGHLMLDYTLTRPVAHSSRPEPTPAELGVSFWNQVLAWSAQQNGTTTRQFDQVMPHLRAFNTQSDGFHDTLHLTVSFRLPPTITPTDVHEAAAAFTAPDSQLQAYSAVEAYRGEKNNALVRGMLTAIRARGGQPGFVFKGGTSDINVVGEVWTCPMIAYGPGDSSLDHTPGECLCLSEYDQAVATLVHVIGNL